MLESTYTSEDGGPFVQFRGTLNCGLNGGWKVKDLLKAFAEYHPHKTYDEKTEELQKLEAGLLDEMRKDFPKQFGRDPAAMAPHERDILLTSIVMAFPDHNVGIEYEENTKFLKSVYVVHTSRR
jgi:hypothetical protein